MDCRIGLLPGQDVAECQRAVEQAVAAAARTDNFLSNNPPEERSGTASSPMASCWSRWSRGDPGRAHRAAFGEGDLAHITTAVNDTRFYGLYFDMPALCYGPKGENNHGFDERTNLAFLKTTTLAMAAFIADWCGLQPDRVRRGDRPRESRAGMPPWRGHTSPPVDLVDHGDR